MPAITNSKIRKTVRDLGELPPNQRARSVDLDPRDRAAHASVHSLLPTHPPFCDPTTSDVFAPLQAGITDVGLVFIEHAPPGVKPAALVHPNALGATHAPRTRTIIGGGLPGTTSVLA